VGAERENLEEERRDELARRVREYKATMEILKKRGARRPRPKREPKGRRGGFVRASADLRRGGLVV
jgi:hypothetical protein